MQLRDFVYRSDTSSSSAGLSLDNAASSTGEALESNSEIDVSGSSSLSRQNRSAALSPTRDFPELSGRLQPPFSLLKISVKATALGSYKVSTFFRSLDIHKKRAL